MVLGDSCAEAIGVVPAQVGVQTYSPQRRWRFGCCIQKICCLLLIICSIPKMEVMTKYRLALRQGFEQAVQAHHSPRLICYQGRKVKLCRSIRQGLCHARAITSRSLKVTGASFFLRHARLTRSRFLSKNRAANMYMVHAEMTMLTRDEISPALRPVYIQRN